MGLNSESASHQAFSRITDVDRPKIPIEKYARLQPIQSSHDVNCGGNQETSRPNALPPNLKIEPGGSPTPSIPSIMSERRQNLLLLFMSLSQLVQMVPVGVGINSGFVIGAALGANAIQSVWVVASYPLTQGSFVLIGMLCLARHARYSALTTDPLQEAGWVQFMATRISSFSAPSGGSSGRCAAAFPTISS